MGTWRPAGTLRKPVGWIRQIRCRLWLKRRNGKVILPRRALGHWLEANNQILPGDATNRSLSREAKLVRLTGKSRLLAQVKEVQRSSEGWEDGEGARAWRCMPSQSRVEPSFRR